MGYPLEDFVDQVDNELICVLCKQVLISPLSCSYCEQLFCEKCIEGAMNNHTGCPSCSQAEVMFSKPHKTIFSMLNKLKAKCINSKQGCEVILELSAKKSHEKLDCLFTLIQCGNEGCQDFIKRQEKEQHIQNCQFKKIPCEQCNSSTSQAEIESHSCIKSLSERLIQQSNQIQQNEVKMKQLQDLTKYLLQAIDQQYYSFSETQKSNNIIITNSRKRAIWEFQAITQNQNVQNVSSDHQQSDLQVEDLSKVLKQKSWFKPNQIAQPSVSNWQTIILDFAFKANKIYRIKFQIIKQKFFDIGIVANLNSFDGAPFYEISDGCGYSNKDCSVYRNKNKICTFRNQAQEGTFIEMIVNTKDRTLGFVVEGQTYDQVFENIPFNKKKFYPAVSRDSNIDNSDGIIDLVWVEVQDEFQTYFQNISVKNNLKQPKYQPLRLQIPITSFQTYSYISVLIQQIHINLIPSLQTFYFYIVNKLRKPGFAQIQSVQAFSQFCIGRLLLK